MSETEMNLINKLGSLQDNGDKFTQILLDQAREREEMAAILASMGQEIEFVLKQVDAISELQGATEKLGSLKGLLNASTEKQKKILDNINKALNKTPDMKTLKSDLTALSNNLKKVTENFSKKIQTRPSPPLNPNAPEFIPGAPTPTSRPRADATSSNRPDLSQEGGKRKTNKKRRNHKKRRTHRRR